MTHRQITKIFSSDDIVKYGVEGMQWGHHMHESQSATKRTLKERGIKAEEVRHIGDEIKIRAKDDEIPKVIQTMENDGFYLHNDTDLGENGTSLHFKKDEDTAPYHQLNNDLESITHGGVKIEAEGDKVEVKSHNIVDHEAILDYLKEKGHRIKEALTGENYLITASLAKSAPKGHPFYGNQHTGGIGAEAQNNPYLDRNVLGSADRRSKIIGQQIIDKHNEIARDLRRSNIKAPKWTEGKKEVARILRDKATTPEEKLQHLMDAKDKAIVEEKNAPLSEKIDYATKKNLMQGAALDYVNNHTHFSGDEQAKRMYSLVSLWKKHHNIED